ncbi:E3 ubiquitin-protein ligase synoviolin A [Clonorchis sinensis]|uniref:E3 ubiquitin-protein ligase synoviolin A n=1 Tax=Clonorchis sinensis TaxID=79923 RepID=A0A8T1MM06_CLOSI|nr:E3 ubiquitin-protein ligase synoviolin A [Clonorchis sinensis]
MRDHPWDKKTMYLLYVDIVVGVARLAFYVEFTVLMWALHPFPLFIARPIYLSVRALKKAVRQTPLGQFPFFPPYFGTTVPVATQPTASVAGLPVYPPVSGPLFAPPFFGMPIIYPGNLFPNTTTPMPEPPSGTPDHVVEARLRASANARLTALRQINVLLNAAVLQMNAYLNASTDANNPWLNGFNPPVSSADAVGEIQNDSDGLTSDEPSHSSAVSKTDTAQPGSSESTTLVDVRKRRLEHFEREAEDVKSKND